jgi:hypothetical protein
MVVVESLPFAKILHVAVDSFPVTDNSFNVAIRFQVFLLSFLFQQESFTVFLRYSRSVGA